MNCHSNCQSCFDAGNTACYVCNAPYYLEGTTCSSVCPDGKYNNSATKLCEACASICLTCTGPDISQCTSCIDNYRLINSATCAPVCGSYYYENTTDYQCYKCGLGAAECYASSLNASACLPGYTLYQKVCYPVCLKGQFSNSQQVCETCDSVCAECSGSARACLKCPTGYYLNYGGICESVCPIGTYTNQTNSTCLNCSTRCSSCTGPDNNQCQSCNSGFFFSNSSWCNQTCPSGFYPNSNGNICSNCHSKCTACFGALETACHSCSSGYFLFISTCAGTCPAGRYADIPTRQCLACTSPCANCTGAGINTCTSCQSGHVLLENSSFCQIVCADTEMFRNPGTNLCVQ